LIIHPRLVIGGAEKVIFLLADNLRRLGVKVNIFFSEADQKALNLLGIKTNGSLLVRDINQSEPGVSKKAFFKSIEYFKDLGELYLFVKKAHNAYDVMNPHNFPAYWSMTAIRNHIPIIWTCHEVLGPYGVFRDYYRNFLMKPVMKLLRQIDSQIVRKYVTEIITNSKRNAKLIAKRYNRRSKVIYPPINLKIYVGKRTSNKPIEGEFVMLQVGSLVKLKNQVSSIIALKIIKKDIPKSKLIILGNGPWKKRLICLSKELKLTKDIMFMDYIEEEALAKIYRSCDLYLSPVLEQSFGLTPFEAIASGTPAIVSRRCGAAEIIQRYAPEMLIEPKPRDLANKILEVYEKYDKFLDRTKHLRRMIARELSPINYAEKTLKIMKRILEWS